VNLLLFSDDALAGEDGRGVVAEIAELLDHPSKPKMLFFAGVEDLVCNHVGIEKSLENIPWKGQSNWVVAERFGWLPSMGAPKAAGFMKQYDNLMFLKVLESGHMVPMDVPEVALEMMKTLIGGGSFTTSKQKIAAENVAPAKTCQTCDVCSVPAPLDCPSCPLSGPLGIWNCTEQVRDAIASSSGTVPNGPSGTVGKNPSTAIGGVILVVALLVYAGWMAKKRSYQNVEVVGGDSVEMQEPRYRDESEL